MFEKKDKRRLYWLIDHYLSNKITETVFCDEFYYSYDLEISDKDLTELEQKTLSELSIVASRYSPYEEDHKMAPRAFFTTNQLKKQIFETKKKLNWKDDYSV